MVQLSFLGVLALALVTTASPVLDQSLQPLKRAQECMIRAPGAFCPNYGSTGLCTAAGEFQKQTCPSGTCCNMDKVTGQATCTRDACHRFDAEEITQQCKASNLPAGSWFCPFARARAVCNEKDEDASHQLCPEGTCCTQFGDGSASCSRVWCNVHGLMASDVAASRPAPPPAAALDICKDRSNGEVCFSPSHRAFCAKDVWVDSRQCPEGTCCTSSGQDGQRTTCTAEACKLQHPPHKKDEDALPQAALLEKNSFHDVCKGRPSGWFCPSPGVTAFCNKNGQQVAGKICPKYTCCGLIGERAFCTLSACSKYDGHRGDPAIAVSPPVVMKPSISMVEVKNHHSADPICNERPSGWTCPSPGRTIFCNKEGELVDGEICPKDTCCAVENGKGVCTRKACDLWKKDQNQDSPDAKHNEILGFDANSQRSRNANCDNRSYGWHCPTPGFSAFCDKDGKQVDGHYCPKDTCCKISKGKFTCSAAACETPPVKEEPCDIIFQERCAKNETIQVCGFDQQWAKFWSCGKGSKCDTINGFAFCRRG